MLIKIITLIAASISTMQGLKFFTKGKYADAFCSGFTLMVLGMLGRIYL